MPDLLLELLSEEIPARMQAKARADLERLLTEQLRATGLRAESIRTYSTPRRLALIARGLPLGTPAVSEELKGPRTSAPPQALEGFRRKTGLTQDQLEDRGGIWFARQEKPGRATTDLLAEAIPAIVRAFPWPKSMRWGAASISTESPRWVRPLQGLVAMLDEELIDFEVGDVRSSAATLGHRFHHPGRITLAGASDYVEKLRACHVIVDHEERAALIREGAAAAAVAAGLTLVPDEGLVEENAGLTEWPVPLLGRFDETFLQVPREVIQLTMRTNQKYFAAQVPSRLWEGPGEGLSASDADDATSPPPTPPASGRGDLAPAFICVANIAAADGGERIVAGNQKVLAARLSDARFFWEQDLKVPLEQQAAKLSQIVFHEKLGTVADKVDRVAKLARWLVEEGIVTIRSSPHAGRGTATQSGVVEGAHNESEPAESPLHHQPAAGGPPPHAGEDQKKLAALVERAARLCKADLVTQMVGEFPELQGLIGGYLAAAQGEDPQVAEAIRDHYKPVGQGDEVPTAPVTVAVSLADKLDTIVSFFTEDMRPSGSKDPFALRRSALGVLSLLTGNQISLPMRLSSLCEGTSWYPSNIASLDERYRSNFEAMFNDSEVLREPEAARLAYEVEADRLAYDAERLRRWQDHDASFLDFFADRLKIQQREAGVRHDLIDAVFALGGEDDLVRLLARVRALQAFVETREGADLLAGYKRAANILKKEGWSQAAPLPRAGGAGGGDVVTAAGSAVGAPATAPPPTPPASGRGETPLSYTPENAENALIAALDSAEPDAAAAIEREDFESAMRALASLRGPVDAFFSEVTVNDPDPVKRAARLDLLARIRGAVHRVADFSRIEG
jgi:glycyl-tRNA synthetase beta chain